MVTMNRPIMLLLTVIQIWNKNVKFQLNRVVYLCLRNICTKFQVDTSFLFWVLLNNLPSICSIWQRPWNHSTNIFIRIFFIASYTLLIDSGWDFDGIFSVYIVWADIATGSVISLRDPDYCYDLWADETTFAYGEKKRSRLQNARWNAVETPKTSRLFSKWEKV